MTVTYRLQGLDGEATEEMIESVAADPAEAADPEETFAATADLRRGDGLETLLGLAPLLDHLGGFDVGSSKGSKGSKGSKAAAYDARRRR